MITAKTNTFQQRFGEAVKPWIVNLAKEAGLDIAGYKHKITSDFEHHVIKQHGDSKKEQLRGNIAVTQKDLKSIEDVMNNPDIAVVGVYKHNEPRIVLVKNSEHGSVLVEEILSGNRNKTLNAKTFWIMKNPLTEDKIKHILEMSNGYDVSKIKTATTADANSAL